MKQSGDFLCQELGTALTLVTDQSASLRIKRKVPGLVGVQPGSFCLGWRHGQSARSPAALRTCTVLLCGSRHRSRRGDPTGVHTSHSARGRLITTFTRPVSCHSNHLLSWDPCTLHSFSVVFLNFIKVIHVLPHIYKLQMSRMNLPILSM